MIDREYAVRCYEENLRFIATEYFRAQLISAQNFPLAEVGRRPIIVVANHSGMGLSWDNIILDFLIYDQLKILLGNESCAIDAKPIRLVDPLLISHGTVAPFGIADWFARIGCVAANSQNFEAAMRRGRTVILSPEGVGGIAKGGHRKYRLQRYSSSFLRMAHAYGALVVPVSVVNAEYLNPWNISLPWVNAVGRQLGFPFVPIGMGALQALVPATYLNPRPAKLIYVVHPATDFAAGHVPALDVLRAEARQFQQSHQAQLDDEVRNHHAPYALREWLRAFGTSKHRRMFSPFFWHEMFLKTAGEPAWIATLYKLPLAYPMIWLAKRLR